MRLEYSDTAFRQLKKLPKNKQIKVLAKIEKLKANPLAGKKLKGKLEGFWSLKAWPYRIIYQYFPQKKLLFVNVIQHRQKVYKGK